MADNHKADELLKAYADKRRQDAGQPLELHPATRRLLQAEAARLRPSSGQRGYSWREMLVMFWPRMAFAAVLVVVMTAITVAVFQEPPELARLAQVPPRTAVEDEFISGTRDKAPEETPGAVERAEHRQRLGREQTPASPESLESEPERTLAPKSETKFRRGLASRDMSLPGAEPDVAVRADGLAPPSPPAAVTAPSAPAPTLAPLQERTEPKPRFAGNGAAQDRAAEPGAVRPGVREQTDALYFRSQPSPTEAMADSRKEVSAGLFPTGSLSPTGTVGFAFADSDPPAATDALLPGQAGSDQVRLAEKLATATSATLRASRAVGETATAPSEPLLELAKQKSALAALGDKVVVTNAGEARAFSGGKSQGGAAGAEPGELGLASLGWRARFHQVAPRNEAPAARLGANRPESPLLQQFDFEHNGREVRIVDADGSVYVGQTMPGAQGIALVGASAIRNPKEIEQPVERDNAVSGGAATVDQQAIPFRASGTNRSLGQLVVFDGVFRAASQDMNGARGAEALRARKRLEAPVQPSTTKADAQIQGQAVIGGTNRIEVRAVSARP